MFTVVRPTADIPGERADRLAGVILSSASEIHDLQRRIDPAMIGDDATLEPRFFLASLSNEWVPRAIVVTRRGVVLGVMYAKERKIFGIPTAILYVDGRLGRPVLAAPQDEDDVGRVAIETLFDARSVRGLRLAIAAMRHDTALARAASSRDLECSSRRSLDAHARLPLSTDYDRFVNSLGSKTRRNFRYYRRRFETAGHLYVEAMSQADVHAAVEQLRDKSKIPARSSEIARVLRVFHSVAHPWAAGLRRSDGAWLSVAAGWETSRAATMFFQLNNDREYADASLSLVLRAYLIETLIREGVPDLLFWAGSAPPLNRYAEPLGVTAVHLDVTKTGWRLMRTAIGNLALAEVVIDRAPTASAA